MTLKTLLLVQLSCMLVACASTPPAIDSPSRPAASAATTKTPPGAPPQDSSSWDWLEDETSHYVRAWTQDQNAKTDAYVKPLRYTESFARDIRDLSALRGPLRPKVSGDNLYYLDFADSKERLSLRVRELANGTDRTMLGPPASGTEGYRAIHNFWPSHDNRYVAVLLDRDGSDVKELVLYRLRQRAELHRVVGPVQDPGVACRETHVHCSIGRRRASSN